MPQFDVDFSKYDRSERMMTFRKLHDQCLDWLSSQYHNGTSIIHLVRARSRFMDKLLKHLWWHVELEQVSGLSLVAVGGYGRGELHPQSDIDLLLLSNNAIDPETEAKISQFITLLWDIRLEVGHSVRSGKECISLGKEDITIATNLMESRLISGDSQPYSQLETQVKSKSFWPSHKFFQAKMEEQIKRHDQYHDTAYNLEPNVKANPGGLRDIQNIGWVVKNHFGADELGQLVEHGFLTVDEHEELEQCQKFLWQVRFVLHMVTNRSEDRLLFDYQAEVARELGYCDEGNSSVEKMMKRLYQTIRQVIELNQMLLQLFDDAFLESYSTAPVTLLDNDFLMRGNNIGLRHPSVFDKSENYIQLLLHVADNRNITGISAHCIRKLRVSRRQIKGYLQHLPECRELFVKLMRHPRGPGRPIAFMHRYGILSSYMPQWERIVGQMQFDLFHAFTVDEHTYRVTKNLYRLTRAEFAQQFPHTRGVMAQINEPDLLFLAALFHDIAKGRGGDHSELGAVDALEFCLFHGYDQEQASLVAWLVEQHLIMSVTAQKRDIQDPEVVSTFAQKIGDVTRLKYLYCLTTADIRATNDNLWNGWKGALLRELYSATHAVLSQGLSHNVDIASHIEETQNSALELIHETVEREQIDLVWQRFKAEYFVRHSPEQVAWHTHNIIAHGDSSEPLIALSEIPQRDSTELFLYTYDTPNLFMNTVKVLDRKNLDVHDAQIMNTKDGVTVDTFVILERDGTPLTGQSRIDEVTESIRYCITNDCDEPYRQPKMERKLKHFNVEAQVKYITSEKDNRTMLELIALDRPGLLVDVATLFHEMKLSLHAAKISTVGERAEDFFSLSTELGEALPDDIKNELKEKLQSVANTTDSYAHP
ncbi:[protein-PII] uridylyltransferase [Echinimonas agarilytica]|uniref:Bifunctional uridylyltransferase/uridylyl-removing enzyme n=1 Tax=Echinimonas agarilytica TaxID=1215918 RepID=A0AA41W554_9GAMM|nr:[protein-PII] uridylyltransferase [Echinimonas agarilytica]MCM2679122.1 [protein-PII] uridylyltransferase [Echinimonas agarilytica]